MISIVAAYHNRKKLLINTLESINKSNYKDFEVIVIDDGSDEEHRLEDILTKYPFLKLIRLEKKNKWYVNPCVPYNIGFKEAKGDIIIIQNPECYHFDDIMTYVNDNLTENDYFSMSCYSLDQNSTENIETIVDTNFFLNKSISHDGDNGWYNHSLYRPVGYHFCAAVHKKNLTELGGFDERYAHGIAFDDNELLVRVIRMGLKLKIVDEKKVLHQWHYSTNNYQNVNVLALIEKNRNLLNNKTAIETTWKANVKEWILPKIPKIMNFYWDGSKMSYYQYLTIVSFRKFNPDWKINIYEPTTKTEIKSWNTPEQKISYVGEDYYPELKKLEYVNFIKFDFKTIGINENISEVFKSDFLRWYLLETVGGGWSDMDILYIKPLDELKLDGTMITGDIESTDTAIVFDGFHHIIGFYLTRPNTGFFKNVFEISKNDLNPSEYQSIGSRLLMRLYPNMEILKNKHPNLNFSNLPMNFLYPYNDSKIDVLFNSTDESLINEKTIGVHWYNGSNISKNYINNNKNISNMEENVISKLIKKYNII